MNGTNVIVFLGPTLRAESARRSLDAAYRGPARKGDILKALQGGASVIGIVDGCLHAEPLWHKEILVALSRGIPVFGAAQMGALRAAELHTFGMVGAGEIFESYRTGLLEDDDEVNRDYQAGDASFTPLSEAMVNIRDAFQRAAAAGIIPPELAARLAAIAKQLHYSDRSYPRIMDLAAGLLSGRSRERLAEFLNTHTPLQERDAMCMLERMSSFLREEPAPAQVSWTMERTVYIDFLLNEIKL